MTSAISALAFLECMVLTFDIYFGMADYFWPIPFSFGLPALWVHWNSRGKLNSATQAYRRKVYQSYTPNRNIHYKKSHRAMRILRSETTTTMKYKPEPIDEFVFYEEGMAEEVLQSELYGFCKTVWRRNQNVFSGYLRSNAIFSYNYFRPKTTFAMYNSYIYILQSRHLLRGRWQGKGGRPVYPPGIAVDEAIRRW